MTKIARGMRVLLEKEDTGMDTENTKIDWPTAPIGKFWWLVGYTQATQPTWRFGQTLFNVLYLVRHDLSEQLRMTPLDPFNLPANKLEATCQWIEEHWND